MLYQVNFKLRRAISPEWKVGFAFSYLFEFLSICFGYFFCFLTSYLFFRLFRNEKFIFQGADWKNLSIIDIKF